MRAIGTRTFRVLLFPILTCRPYCVNKSEETNKLCTNLVSPPKYLNTLFSTFQPEIKTFLFLAFQFQMRIDVKRKACQLLASRTDNTQYFYILPVPVVKFSTISDLFSVLSCSSFYYLATLFFSYCIYRVRLYIKLI